MASISLAKSARVAMLAITVISGEAAMVPTNIAYSQSESASLASDALVGWPLCLLDAVATTGVSRRFSVPAVVLSLVPMASASRSLSIFLRRCM